MIEIEKNKKWYRQGKLWIGLTLSFVLPILLLQSLNRAAAQPAATFGYGANVAEWDIAKLDSMGFNWIKVFNGPGSRLPLNVLLRVDANASHLSNVSGFGDTVESLAQSQKGFVEAYEEPLCVGCGRCGEACLANITVPEVISSVRGEE